MIKNNFVNSLVFYSGQNASNKKGQIWIETVIYTMIAFMLIGLVLAFAKPKIEESQDKGIIEQSINVLEEINQIIKNIGSAGNQRTVIIQIGKGTLNLDGENDKIFFTIESKYLYSEPGETLKIGNVNTSTEQKGNINEVNLILDYQDKYNITYNNIDTIEKINKASTPFKILISNKGISGGNKININLEIIN